MLGPPLALNACSAYVSAAFGHPLVTYLAVPVAFPGVIVRPGETAKLAKKVVECGKPGHVRIQQPFSPVEQTARVSAGPLMEVGDRLESWIGAMGSGDESALGALYRACRARVRACAIGIVRSAALADEVVSACFAQAWRAAASFDRARGSAITWLLTIARSRALDVLRREAKRARHESPFCDEDQLENVLAPAQQEPHSAWERSRRDASLRAMLDALAGTQRQVLWLAFVDGLSHEEIALHCDMPLGTVKSHIQRGIKTLRLRCSKVGFER